MKKLLFLIFVVLFSNVTASAFNLSGNVNNSLEYHLGARIDVSNSTFTTHTFTDVTDGSYQINDLGVGDYTVLVRQIKYRNNSENISIIGDTFHNVSMEKIRMPILEKIPGFEGIGILFVIIIIFTHERLKNESR